MEETRMQSFKRKIQEQYLALKLEKTLTAEGENAKDVILEKLSEYDQLRFRLLRCPDGSADVFRKGCKRSDAL